MSLNRRVYNLVAVRKRAAPSDEANSASEPTSTTATSDGSFGINVSATNDNPQSSFNATVQVKEAAWSLKEVVFIKEEFINDTGIVKIVSFSK